MDQEDRQNIRLALAAVFMHARIISLEVGYTRYDLEPIARETIKDEALKDADALLAEFEKESP